MITTKGIPKAEVLVALYNNAKCLGMGYLQYVKGPLSLEEAERLLQGTINPPDYPGKPMRDTTHFDYLKGRVMKVSLKDDNGFEEGLYDRDNGKGAALKAIAPLYAKFGLKKP